MLGLAEARQVGIDGGDDGTLVAEVDLDLAEVLALFEQMRGVGMTQRVNVRGLFHTAGFKGEPEGALQRGAAYRFGGGGGALAAVAPGGEDQRGMPMRFPELAQEQERAPGQWDVTILIALAGADVEEHAPGINVADLEVQAFPQTQAAGINGDQTDAMIQGGHGRQDAAGFGSGEDDGEFELGLGADQLKFGGPDAFECFFPEELEGADDLGGSLAGDFFDGLEVDAVLAELLGRDLLGRLGIELGELAQAGVISLSGARTQGLKRQIISEGF